MTEANPIVTLKVKIKEFSFSKLKAGESNKSAHSGETMYFDLPRMNFVINGKIIDTVLTSVLMEGAKYRKSNLFNSYDIYSAEAASKKQREIDKDHGRAFVNSVLKDLEKELAYNALSELWESHCENPEIPDYQKTNSYGRDFERFYNAGREHMHLLLKVGDENKNYRPFVKEVFKEMFKYAEAEVPSAPILEELVIALFTIIRTDHNMLLLYHNHKHISYPIRTIARSAILTCIIFMANISIRYKIAQKVRSWRLKRKYTLKDLVDKTSINYHTLLRCIKQDLI